MILDEYIEIRLISRNINYYQNIGYKGNVGDIITIKTTDLSKGCHKKIRVKCDNCGKIREAPFKEILQTSHNFTRPQYCHACSWLSNKKTNQERYGVDFIMQSERFKEIRGNNMENKYGTRSPLGVPEYQEKYQITMKERWGDHPLQNEIIREKKIATNMEKYGSKSPLQNQKIKEKVQATNIKRYGGITPMSSPEIREKAQKTMCANSTQQISSQQKYLADLYNGELNHPCSSFSLDIYLPEHQLDIEYNGGGHDLCVQMNTMTQEEFNQKEIIRGRIIRSKGINQMTLISRNDKLPSDKILLQMLDKALKYFQETNHHWMTYDIDHQTVENALGTFFYDYGQLRSKRQFYKEITKEAS